MAKSCKVFQKVYKGFVTAISSIWVLQGVLQGSFTQALEGFFTEFISVLYGFDTVCRWFLLAVGFRRCCSMTYFLWFCMLSVISDQV